MSSSSSFGDLFLLRGGYLLFLLLYASKSLPSVILASSGCVFDVLKCVHPRNLDSPLCIRILERIHDALLPIYRTTLPSALPISYIPDWFIGKALISVNLNGIHLVLSGISRLLPHFRLFYTRFVIDSNHLLMLPLAKKLEVEQGWNTGV